MPNAPLRQRPTIAPVATSGGTPRHGPQRVAAEQQQCALRDDHAAVRPASAPTGAVASSHTPSGVAIRQPQAAEARWRANGPRARTDGQQMEAGGDLHQEDRGHHRRRWHGQRDRGDRQEREPEAREAPHARPAPKTQQYRRTTASAAPLMLADSFSVLDRLAKLRSLVLTGPPGNHSIMLPHPGLNRLSGIRSRSLNAKSGPRIRQLRARP